jgi:hypothetical protein
VDVYRPVSTTLSLPHSRASSKMFKKSKSPKSGKGKVPSKGPHHVRPKHIMAYVTYTSKQRRLTTKKSFQPTIVVTYTSAFLVLNGQFVMFWKDILSKAGHSTTSEWAKFAVVSTNAQFQKLLKERVQNTPRYNIYKNARTPCHPLIVNFSLPLK